MSASPPPPAALLGGATTALNCQLDLSVIPDQIVEIAEKAGAAILEVYHSKDWDKNVQQKDDKSPLTAADSAANAVICAELGRISPHIPIVSEETKLVPFEVRKHYVYWWCVDPLDGTKEFLKRNGQFTVNIALVKGNRPILGVVHTPCLQQTHWAVQGRGAFLRDHSLVSGSDTRDISAPGGDAGSMSDATDVQIHAAVFSEQDKGLTVAGSASHGSKETEEFLQRFKGAKMIAMGSSLKFMLVAEGRAHVYPRMGPTSEWDTCASQIIVEEAGGEVLKFPEMTPLQYGKENILNPFFVVYGKRKL